MTDTSTKQIADLRFPQKSLEPRGNDLWSQWSAVPLIELSARDTSHFVKTMIPPGRQKILEVGCGNGYLCLELAREGHEVIGLDRSAEIIEVAQRSRTAHPDTTGFGTLTYVCADITTWQARDQFDLVVITRTLHHLHTLAPTLSRVKSLLTSTGRLICQDYAYDRLNEQTASWLYAMLRLLQISGLADGDLLTASNDAQAIAALQTAWFQRAAHRLHGYEDMLHALQATFHTQQTSWVPYLFVYLANQLRSTTAEQEHALIPFLRNMEQQFIEQDMIQAVGFRYVGSV